MHKSLEFNAVLWHLVLVRIFGVTYDHTIFKCANYYYYVYVKQRPATVDYEEQAELQ